MTWVKLDDQFPNHPKVVKAGGDAAWLYVAALCYTNYHLTDGFIPDEILGRLTDRKNPSELAERLLGCGALGKQGLFERGAGGYHIHDYHDDNAPAEEVRAKREALAEERRVAGREGGRRSGEARRQAKLKQVASFPPSNGESKTKPHSDSDSSGSGDTHTARAPRDPASPSSSPVGASEHQADDKEPLQPLPLALPPDPPAPGLPDGLQLGRPREIQQRLLVESHLAEALPIFDALKSARRRCRPRCTVLRPTFEALAGVANRLAAGSTVEECHHVIAVLEAEVRGGNDETWRHFDAVSPWRPDNFLRALGRTVEDAGKPRALPASARPPPPAEARQHELAEETDRYLEARPKERFTAAPPADLRAELRKIAGGTT